MVIRKAERNVAIPENVQAERDWIITECTRIEDAINAAADIEELVEIKATAWVQEQEQQDEIVIEPTDTKWLHEDIFAVKWLVEIGFESPKDKLQLIDKDDDEIEAP